MSGANPISQISAKEGERLGLPPNLKFWSAGSFAGINQQDSRTSIDDMEFFWVENFLLTGKSYYRALWDQGEPLYTVPPGTLIIYFTSFNIGNLDYFAVFLDDGTAVQVSFPDGAITVISDTPSLFFRAGTPQLPVGCQSGTQYLLIGNNNTNNDYWVWDGKVLYGAGSIAPVQISEILSAGAGYTSVPTATVYGGSGTGVSLTPVLSNGSIVALIVDNPGSGYLPTDNPQVAFSGGGSDDTPILTATLSAGVVTLVTLSSGGAGYPTGTFPLAFSGGGGTGAAGTYTVVSGTIKALSLTSGGSGYTGSPTVTFPGQGSGAAITATEAGGSITALTVTAGGSGYVPGTYALAFSGGGGTGAAGTYTVNSSGVVASALVTVPGSGYTSAPTVTLPTGSGAVAVASITSSSVASITVVNGGTNLTGTPTVTIVGGGGSGATAVATISGGSITSVAVTDAGSGYTTTPAVQVSVGENNSAAANLALMPFGVSGTSIETFLSRVWISNPAQIGPTSNGGVFNVSAPESLSDFSSADGGDLFTSSDRFLKKAYTALHQSNGYLYPIADSSVSVISNVQTGGSPTATTFNYQNTSAQIGAAWRDTVQDYGQAVLMANRNGVQGLYGGAVQRVSKKMNNVFENAVFPPDTTAVVPSGAVANIYTIPVYLLNMTLLDPRTNTKRTVMMAWDEKNWLIASQASTLTFIGTQEISSVLTAWGTDGAGLFPLFATPSETLTKSLSTKMYGADRDFLVKQPMTTYVRASDFSSSQVGIAMTIEMESYGIAQQIGSMPGRSDELPSYKIPNGIQPNFTAPMGMFPVWSAATVAVVGTAVGATLSSNSPDFVLSGLTISYREDAANFG